MDLPLPVVVAVANAILLAAGLLVFLPEGLERPRWRDVRRAVDKYSRYAVAALVVLALHVLLVQLDPSVSSWLGWDFTWVVRGVEDGAVRALSALWTPPVVVIASVGFAIVLPVTLYFAPLLFMLSDDERAAKASLLMFPLAYAMALPFYLFFPVRSAFAVEDAVTPPVAEVFPQIWAWYGSLTSLDNSFPALAVAFALLVANASRYSRNVRFRYFAFANAGAVIAAALYLNVSWIADVVGGAAVAAVAATLTSRILSVERLARERVKPGPEEAQAVASAADELVAAVRAQADALGWTDAKPLLVGSVAKDTYLASRVDLDVFVLFPPTLPREELERRGLEIGRRVLPDGEESYAEHPYITGRWRHWDADVVPAYEVDDPARRLSAVDRTPFHTRLVLARMSRDERDQTRLLKQFMGGVGVYGAEARTRGFSGYLCELLALKYRTFRGVVRAGAKWKPGTFLSLETHEGNPKFTDPLVFLDPVDPRRNAASAVSVETLALFGEACRAYLHRESLSFFFPRQLVPLPPDELERVVRRRRGELVLVTIPKPDVLEDHLHDQLRKAAGAVTSLLERHEFEPKRATTEVGKTECRILVELPRLRLPEGIAHSGPPLKEAEHAERFRKAWTGNPEALTDVYEEDGRYKVKRRREFRRTEDLLRAKLTTLDLGKHVSRAARDGFEVASGVDVVREATAMILTRHLNRKKPWEI